MCYFPQRDRWKNHRPPTRCRQSDKTDSRQNAIFSRATTPERLPREPGLACPSSFPSHPVFLLSLSLSFPPLPPQRPIIVTSPRGIPKMLRPASSLMRKLSTVLFQPDPPFLVLPNSVNARPPTRWFMLMPIHVENEAVEMERADTRVSHIRLWHGSVGWKKEDRLFPLGSSTLEKRSIWNVVARREGGGGRGWIVARLI